MHILPCPDVLRGQNLDGGAAARDAVGRARARGARVCAFFSESILSCGGQVRASPPARHIPGATSCKDQQQVAMASPSWISLM